MNRNAARKCSAANGGSLNYDPKTHTYTVTRKDGKQSLVGTDMLFRLDAAEFRRRYLEVPNVTE